MENNLREFYTKGERIDLTISDIAEKDQCFGRLENGTAVLVRGVLAIGDRIEATVTKVRPTYLEANVDKMLTVSADRVEPVCPVFGVCGGCKWMHVGYDAQLRYKQKKVHDALVHIGGFQELSLIHI